MPVRNTENAKSNSCASSPALSMPGVAARVPPVSITTTPASRQNGPEPDEGKRGIKCNYDRSLFKNVSRFGC